jgi:KaiC/GvpD/RAD55 family RecA-like ATPase
MERTKTGIPGLDELVQGGFPASSTVLVSGSSGTGKTILAMQYLYNGAKFYGEPGIYVTLETHIKNILWNMENFNWDFKSLQEKNMLRTYRLNIELETEKNEIKKKIDEELNVITRLVEEIGAKRLVIDSIASFGIWFERLGELRAMLYHFTDKLKDLECTTILTTETKGERTDFSAFGVEDFIADGVIALYFFPPNRSIFIKKMRGTNQSKSVHPFEITEQGIIVKSKDRILWESMR